MAVARKQSRDQKGYLLLSIMLLMTLMLIGLSVVLPRISQQIKRDKEGELIHRGEEYAKAVRKFYRKFGRYPLSIEQLESTNNMKFLRKRFKDPMTGKDDWRIVHQGEIVQTLTGNGATTNLNGPPGVSTSPSPSPSPSPTPTPGTGQDSQNSSGLSSGSGAGQSSPASAFGNPQPGGGPMAGVASIRKDESIKIRSEKNHYNDWIFFYDPSQEQQQLGGGLNNPKNPDAGKTKPPGTTGGTQPQF